eukprot:EC792472.1.p1 GENE.EC792472.1~~EC792472.1.p1  ORF type:complete len:139 (+),score=23.93 EC792472.1:30-446(+)
MGCSQAKADDSGALGGALAPGAPQHPWSFDAHPEQTPPTVKVDRKTANMADFVSSGKRGQVVVKEPGSLAGQQYVIEDCTDCDFFILDHVAAVNLDNCDRCRVFIGPCKGSMFLRNCKYCKVVVACQQSERATARVWM